MIVRPRTATERDQGGKVTCIHPFRWCVTPRQLVLRTRVDRATRLLAAGEGTLAHVAAASGFYDQPSLTRTFARLTGETPAQY
ncbi:helix-turn-helix domain-containing protein, partial [Streptomyces sp. NPDC056194]|uniref:helix-turn-helix domain-containing protein n=1 Tax=Streptomyces sp. NPDC056194 TaxID=3345744 RepID=UPI0035DD22F0